MSEQRNKLLEGSVYNYNPKYGNTIVNIVLKAWWKSPNEKFSQTCILTEYNGYVNVHIDIV